MRRRETLMKTYGLRDHPRCVDLERAEELRRADHRVSRKQDWLAHAGLLVRPLSVPVYRGVKQCVQVRPQAMGRVELHMRMCRFRFPDIERCAPSFHLFIFLGQLSSPLPGSTRWTARR